MKIIYAGWKKEEIHDHNLSCMSNLNNELTFLYIFSFHKTSMSRLIRFIKEKVYVWIDFDIVTQIPEIIQLVIPKDKKLHYLLKVRLHQCIHSMIYTFFHFRISFLKGHLEVCRNVLWYWLQIKGRYFCLILTIVSVSAFLGIFCN